MKRLVIDASFVAKLYFEESDSDLAREVAAQSQLAAPDLLIPELANICWKKVARGQAAANHAALVVQTIESAGIDFRPSLDLAREAMSMSLAANRPAYDCFYLALAKSLGCPLVTADARLQTLGLDVQVLGLAASLAWLA